MENLSDYIQKSIENLKKNTYQKPITWKDMVWKFYQRVNAQNEYDNFPKWEIGVFMRDLGGKSVSELQGWWQDCDKAVNFTIRYKQLRKLYPPKKKPKQNKLF